MKTKTLSVRIDKDTAKRIDTLAKQQHQSKASIVNAALAEYLAVQDWRIAGIKEAMAQIDKEGGVPHERVREWIDSWGTENELPMPTP